MVCRVVSILALIVFLTACSTAPGPISQELPTPKPITPEEVAEAYVRALYRGDEFMATMLNSTHAPDSFKEERAVILNDLRVSTMGNEDSVDSLPAGKTRYEIVKTVVSSQGRRGTGEYQLGIVSIDGGLRVSTISGGIRWN